MLTKEQKQYLRSSILRYRSPQNLKVLSAEKLNTSCKQNNYYLDQRYFMAPNRLAHFRTRTEQSLSSDSMDLIKHLIHLMEIFKRKRFLNKQIGFRKIVNHVRNKQKRDTIFADRTLNLVRNFKQKQFNLFKSSLTRNAHQKHIAVMRIFVLLYNCSRQIKQHSIRNIQIRAIRQQFTFKSLQLFVTQIQNLQKIINLRKGFIKLKYKAMKNSLIKRNFLNGIQKIVQLCSNRMRNHYFILLNVKINTLSTKQKFKRSDSQQSSQNPQDSHSQLDLLYPILLFKSNEYTIYLNDDQQELEQQPKRLTSLHGEEVTIERITTLSFNIGEKKLTLKGQKRDVSPNQKVMEFLDHIQVSNQGDRGRTQTLKKGRPQQRGSLKNSLFFLFQNEKQDRFLARAVKRSQSENLGEQTEGLLSQRIMEVERSPSKSLEELSAQFGSSQIKQEESQTATWHSYINCVLLIVCLSIQLMIGLMSGTSLDGVDLVYVDEDLHILKGITYPYSNEWIQRLSNGKEEDDEDYTRYLGELINKFMNTLDGGSEVVKLICSHGHTIKHQPQLGITRQIGNSQLLANLTKKTVVCDFRVQDVELGGQGAPLVPIGDRILFGEYDYCLNLGGFSNISYENNGERIAFDICAVNTVLNELANQLNQQYDCDGLLAQQGEINQKLLMELNNLEYYQKQYPKSLGIEWVRKEIFPILQKYLISVNDKLCTFVEHIAIQINHSIKKDSKVLATGGGVWNQFLLKRLLHYVPNIVIPDKQIVDFKEALIFALLGQLRIQQKVNVLCSVTGAKHDHSSGMIYFPQ